MEQAGESMSKVDTASGRRRKRIVGLFEPEFAKLSLVTLMLPWGDVGWR